MARNKRVTVWFALLVYVISFSGAAFSSDLPSHLYGTWQGVLKVPGGELPLILNIPEDGNPSMDSPAQGAKGIPVAGIGIQNDQFVFAVPSIGGRFTAAYSGGDVIEGVWMQGGASFSLIFKKAMGISRPALKRSQTITPPFPYHTEEVEFLSADGQIRLSGTFSKPEVGDAFPAVVLVSGSGPQDRNETIAGHKPFLVLADYLTKQGFAVLRYDDRGVGKSGGVFQGATTYDFAGDAKGAVLYLSSRGDVDKTNISVIGHSEGGIVAAMLATECDCLSKAVLLAGPTIDYAKLVVEQVRTLNKASGATKAQTKAAVALQKDIVSSALSVDDPVSVTEVVAARLLAAGYPEGQARQQAASFASPWMMAFLRIDPARYLERVNVPVLALYGGKDSQVSAKYNVPAAKAALEKSGQEGHSVLVLEGLNHLFQTAETGLPQEYGMLSETFAPKALKVIGDWLQH